MRKSNGKFDITSLCMQQQKNESSSKNKKNKIESSSKTNKKNLKVPQKQKKN
jgi:hypothetical protein